MLSYAQTHHRHPISLQRAEAKSSLYPSYMHISSQSILNPSWSCHTICHATMLIHSYVSYANYGIIAPFSYPEAAHAYFPSISLTISALRSSGFLVLAQRPLTLPSLPTRNFSKFHLTRFRPIRPGFSFLSHSKAGSAPSPLTCLLVSKVRVWLLLRIS